MYAIMREREEHMCDKNTPTGQGIHGMYMAIDAARIAREVIRCKEKHSSWCELDILPTCDWAIYVINAASVLNASVSEYNATIKKELTIRTMIEIRHAVMQDYSHLLEIYHYDHFS